MAQSKDPICQFAAPDTRNTGSPDTLFVARPSGLFRSSDGGQTWTLAYRNLTAGQVLPTTSVALGPDYEHEPAVFAGLNGALLCSADGGLHWHPGRLPSPPPTITSLVVSPRFAEDGIVFAGTSEDGVLVTADRGQSWAAWNFGLLDLTIFCLALSPDFGADETIYAGAESGLFRSTNGGRAWKEVPLPIGFDAALSLTLSPGFAQDHSLFVGTEKNGLLISRDLGASWAPISEPTREQPVNAIVVSPAASSETEILLLHGGSLLLSTNWGKTWKPWQTRKLAGRDATAILAPRGLREGLWVGFADGAISRL